MESYPTDINYGTDIGGSGYYDAPMYPQMAPNFINRMIPRNVSCTPKTIYLIFGFIAACIICLIIIKEKFLNPSGVVSSILSPASYSYSCSQICCFLLCLFVTSLAFKPLCDNGKQSIAWGLLLFFVCLQCLCISSLLIT